MKIFPSLNDIVYLDCVVWLTNESESEQPDRMSGKIESCCLQMPNTMSCYCLLSFRNNAHFILFSKYHCVLICYFRHAFAKVFYPVLDLSQPEKLLNSMHLPFRKE